MTLDIEGEHFGAVIQQGTVQGQPWALVDLYVDEDGDGSWERMCSVDPSLLVSLSQVISNAALRLQSMADALGNG